MKRLANAPPEMTFESLRDALVNAEKQGEDARWRSGRAYYFLKRKRFFKRYKNPAAFVKAELEKEIPDPPTPAELTRRARVASTFDEWVVQNGGMRMENLYLALTLFDKLDYVTFSRDDPGNERIQVPQDDGSVVTKRLQQCTKRELERANKAAKGEKTKDPLSPTELAAQKLGQAALSKLVGADGRSKFLLLHRNGNDYFDLEVMMQRKYFDRLLSVLKGLF